ncbi:MAG: hypothetical protein KBB78_03265 [Candidatus Pacebacteria bacterium]|nr:hypothetical protein [Candidatus Paceibacterota bacterium]
MDEKQQTAMVSCKDKVMSRIECEHICPRSKTFFKTRECGVWALWGVSVIVGALSVAVSLFVISHRQYALYEATHENFFTFMVEALPYLWIIVFALMVGVAVYNLRHTKSGYRYPLWQIFGSSMVLSLAGGTAMHVFGFGYNIDHQLGQMPLYASQEKMEISMWQNPEDGRLLGRIVEPPRPPMATATFTDVSGNMWQIDMTELAPHEQELLMREDNVKLIGILDKDTMLFHSCGAFPWLLDKPVRREDLEAARMAFETKIHSFEERVEKKMSEMDQIEEGKRGDDSPCEEIAPVKRMRREEE